MPSRCRVRLTETPARMRWHRGEGREEDEEAREEAGLRRLLRQGRHVRHDGRVLLIDRPEVTATETTVVVHSGVFAGVVQVAWRLL